MSDATALEIARRCAQHLYDHDPASRQLGIAYEVISPGVVNATMRIRPDMVNGHDICHGGFIFSLADSAFAFACNAYNEVNVAASAQIDFVAAARSGDRLTAHASETQRGRRMGLYDVRVSDDAGQLIAVFRGRSMSLARPLLTDLYL